jgi:hypothetical protein
MIICNPLDKDSVWMADPNFLQGGVIANPAQKAAVLVLGVRHGSSLSSLHVAIVVSFLKQPNAIAFC